MIIPSHSFGVVASSRPRIVVSGGSDVTPNAVNWNDVSGGFGTPVYTNTVTITGISTAINLTISWSGNDVGSFSISINGGSFIDLESDGGSPRTFSISNNDTIRFAASIIAGMKIISATVTNSSDGNAVLDTFTMTVYGEE
jgi:hypothetical protein